MFAAVFHRFHSGANDETHPAKTAQLVGEFPGCTIRSVGCGIEGLRQHLRLVTIEAASGDVVHETAAGGRLRDRIHPGIDQILDASAGLAQREVPQQWAGKWALGRLIVGRAAPDVHPVDLAAGHGDRFGADHPIGFRRDADQALPARDGLGDRGRDGSQVRIAAQKTRQWYEILHLPTLGDDDGLVAESLYQQPALRHEESLTACYDIRDGVGVGVQPTRSLAASISAA